MSRMKEKSDDEREKTRLEGDDIDEQFGFARFKEGGDPRVGWLLNYLAISMPDESGAIKSGLDLYFIDREGENFKATIFYEPYFYVVVPEKRRFNETVLALERKFDGCKCEAVQKEDLDLPNHLSGKMNQLLKISFGTVRELMDAKMFLRPIVEENKKKKESIENNYLDGNFDGQNQDNVMEDGYDDVHAIKTSSSREKSDPFSSITDMREYDVPYTMRVTIDMDLRVGSWHNVTPLQGSEVCDVKRLPEMLERCEPRVLAFDIECEKDPLKFPNAERDAVFMISYMLDGQGYLLINREIVSADIDDFDYTQLEQYPGPFQVINLPDETAVLRKFIAHVQELRPHVLVTYNGDFFDLPYVDQRCRLLGRGDKELNLYRMLGIRNTAGTGPGAVGSAEYTGRCMVHLDAFCWVNRDSYLPQGNRGLKAVTRYKLGYDPIEVDPEDMVPLAKSDPEKMAAYSVSDAVATYYLYQKYVHNFIFSLATIIPMVPEDVLRKGSGTLCEALLMVEAYRSNVICPNKEQEKHERFYKGHLLESETYIGGHVECLEAGVFRKDIPNQFNLTPGALQDLIDHVDRDLTFALEVENGVQRSEVANYDEIRQEVVEALEMLRDNPRRKEKPAIYHLDVGAMYPNIILTNRLQPSSMVSLSDCAACEFNHPSSACKRDMSWIWRGEFSPAGMGEYANLKESMQYKKFPSKYGAKGGQGGADAGNKGGKDAEKDALVAFSDLTISEQSKHLTTGLKNYSQRVYRKQKVTNVEERVDTVCMRENGFYVDTVRAFRDRRYDYKLATKKWKSDKNAAEKAGDALAKKKAEDMEVLMDSLQLAHKCILNSFYGYVMRKGARWRSMEMAGIVTKTGADLITKARELVENLGRPLELDTDGIWCILPQSFPQEYKFKLKSGKSVKLEYPCAMLNADVHMNYTNHQYQDLKKDSNRPGRRGVSKEFSVKSECSIYFELDGPYQCMVLPASPEEGKLLKKKYVVYNEDGSIAELKGFEIKRRGELELVKIFQDEVFKQFLSGDTLEECYDAVGAVANYWLDVLDNQGRNIDDEELLGYISEKKTISKTVDDYEGRKATSLTTAQRLADFLGAEMVKDKGLNCQLIISKLPAGAPVTDRAIPVAIFGAEKSIKEYWLRKWTKNPRMDCDDFRDLLDWAYYRERLAKSIQKIITLPAGLQGVENPVPSVEHPPWLQKVMTEKASGLKQVKLTSMFARRSTEPPKDATSTPGHGKGSSPVRGRHLVAGGGLRSPTRAGAELPPTGRRQQSPSPLRGSHGAGTGVVESPLRGRVEHSPGGSKVRLLSSPARSTGLPVSARKRLYSTTDGGSAGLPGGLFGEREGASPSRADTHASPARGGGSEGKEATVDENQSPDTPQVSAMRDAKPESEEELHGWLKARKAKWTALRREKAARRGPRGQQRSSYTSRGGAVDVGELYAEEAGGTKKAKSVEDIVRGASLAASQGFWQIVELQESDSPGEFTVWAMTNKHQLQRFSVRVPRTIYVNVVGLHAERAARQLGGVQVKKDLPHGRPCMKLFQVDFSESRYQRNEKALANFLTDPNVEGVYESQVPLWFKGVTQLGCVAKLSPGAIGTGAPNRTFKVEELEQIHVNQHPYLETSTSTYKKIFLFQSENKISNNGMGCLGLFLVHGTNADHESKAGRSPGASKTRPTTTTAYVWFVQGPNKISHVRPPMDRFYRESVVPGCADRVSFIVNSETTFENAFARCNEQLMTYLQRRQGPTIVIAQGLGGPRVWRKKVTALQEFPLATMPINSGDNQYAAVGWQRDAAVGMIGRYHLFPRWFAERLMCARYAHAPVCNLGSDLITSTIDIVFARQLSAQRHLLWASEKPTPDVAGEELDLQSLWGDALSKPQINNPGAYRNICCELSLTGLAICAIMNSGMLTTHNMSFAANNSGGNTSSSVSASARAAADATAVGLAEEKEEQDGEGLGGASDELDAEAAAERFLGGVGSVFSDSSCIAAFQHLKSKVTAWHTEVNIKGDVISDNILTSLYRYLCGFGNALLYDPALYRFIYGLMSKLFRNLIGELSRLGTKIIYADFNRIIIHTDKSQLDVASSYVQFLIDTVETKELYLFLELTQRSFHEQMLWHGPENYGAIGYDEQELAAVLGPSEGEGDGDGEEGDMSDEAVEDADKGEHEHEHEDHSAMLVTDGSGSPAASEPVTGKMVSFFDRAGPEGRGSGKATSKALFTASDPIEEDEEEDEDENLDWLYNDGDEEGGRDHPEDGHYPHSDPSQLLGVDTEAPAEEEGIYQGHLLEEDPRLTSNWNLAAPLHPSALAQFNLVVSEFMYKYQKLRSKYTAMRDRWLEMEKAGFEKEKLSYYAEQEGLGPLDGGKEVGSDEGGAGPSSAETTHEDIEPSSPGADARKEKVSSAEVVGAGADAENSENEAAGHPETDQENSEAAMELAKDTEEEADVEEEEEKEEEEEEEEEEELEYDEDGEYVGPVSDDDIQERVLEAMRLYIRGALMEKMLDTVDELKEYLPHTEGEEGADLAIGQQHHMMRDVALNFVKATMHVLLVDRHLNEEVASLRKKILAHLKVKEFSEDSRFHDFAASYVLRDIICGFCKCCKDVDLLKDPNLTGVDKEHRWACLDCGNMLDTVEIENRLLNEVERLTSSFLMQDARCSVSHQVSTKLLSATSHIAAPLQMDVTPTTQHQKLTVLREVARFHGFSLLQNTVEEVLDI